MDMSVTGGGRLLANGRVTDRPLHGFTCIKVMLLLLVLPVVQVLGHQASGQTLIIRTYV